MEPDTWRNSLFTLALAYTFPISTLAYLPAVWLCIKTETWSILVIDSLAYALFFVITYIRGIPLGVRKWTFLGIVYGVAVFLLLKLGILGPGLLYLLATSMFVIIFLPTSYALWPSILNLGLYLGLSAASLLGYWSVGGIGPEVWMVVASNMVFLSFTASALFPGVFRGFQLAMGREKIARARLDSQNQQLKEAMLTLESRNHDLAVLASAASHDLREPARLIIALQGRLLPRLETAGDPRMAEMVSLSQDAARRMLALMDDLLQFLQMDTEPQAPKKVDLNSLMVEIKHLFANDLKSKSGSFEWTDLPTLTAHEPALYRIFTNLVGNALKYHAPGHAPRVMVHCSASDNGYLIGVQDEGIGIPPEHREKVFHAFTRLHGNTAYPGTGLGLAIVRKAVDLFGGNIWVTDNPGGQGSIFWIALPQHL
jgi:signal transduction histidine kinase